MQTASILAVNPEAKVFAISAAAHQGITELLRELQEDHLARIEQNKEESGEASRDGHMPQYEPDIISEIPTISLSPDAIKTTWKVEKTEDDKFIVTGDKIERFAKRTDMNNYASVNRLRDIMKKMGIKAELTSLGAAPESIISIAGKEFTLVEDW